MLTAADRAVAQMGILAYEGLDGSEARSLQVDALGRRGTALAMLARPEEAREALEASVLRADPVGDLDVLRTSLSNLASIEELIGALEPCLAHRRQSLDIAERMGDPQFIAFQLGTVGGALEKLGRNEEALQYYQRARDLLAQIGSSWCLPHVLNGIGRIAMLRGDWAEAARCLEEARAMAERHGDLQALVVIECDLAQLECDGGHPERARDRLTTFLAGASRGAATENAAWGMPVWSQLAEAHLALGEVEEAERIAAHGAEQALAAREQLRYVPALIARGAALGRRGC
jgi:tetratricopeptide (TPR) repeat protein